MWHFVSGLLTQYNVFKVHPCCSSYQYFILFNCQMKSHLNNTMQIHRILFIQLSVDGHLVCFHWGTIINNASMNIEIQVVWTYIFIRYLPMSGIPGSYGDYFQHFEELPSCFPKWLHHLHSYQQCVKIPAFPHPYQHLLLSVYFFIMALLGSVE